MNHVDTSTPGVVRIKAFGKMKVDAALIATMNEIESYQDPVINHLTIGAFRSNLLLLCK